MEWPRVVDLAASKPVEALAASSQAISHLPSQESAANRNLEERFLLVAQAPLELVALNSEAVPSSAEEHSLALALSAVHLVVAALILTATLN